MIDMQNDETLQPIITELSSSMHDKVEYEVIAKDETLQGGPNALFPPTIRGFNLRSKMGHEAFCFMIFLPNHQIQTIKLLIKSQRYAGTRNFKSLVINGKINEPVEAPVNNRVAVGRWTELLHEKGNESIIPLQRNSLPWSIIIAPLMISRATRNLPHWPEMICTGSSYIYLHI